MHTDNCAAFKVLFMMLLNYFFVSVLGIQFAIRLIIPVNWIYKSLDREGQLWVF